MNSRSAARCRRRLDRWWQRFRVQLAHDAVEGFQLARCRLMIRPQVKEEVPIPLTQFRRMLLQAMLDRLPPGVVRFADVLLEDLRDVLERYPLQGQRAPNRGNLDRNDVELSALGLARLLRRQHPSRVGT
jgi:hypothetical protein